MNPISRRNALKTLGLSALGLSLAKIALPEFEGLAVDDDLERWLQRLSRNARELRESSISPLQWQEMMDVIYRDTPLAALKDHVEFASMRNRILEAMPSDRGEFFHTIRLLDKEDPSKVNGKEPKQVLITKIAHVKKGRSIPPHGHSNMVSAFLCLSGEFEVRLYDQIAKRDDHLVVRNRLHEKAAGAGTWSSVSDYRDNVHWLKAKSDDCFLFTTKMLSVEENLPLIGRINLDVINAKELGSAIYLAPVISHKRAKELY